MNLIFDDIKFASGDTTVYKSYYPKADEIKNDWVVVDAAVETLGRLDNQDYGFAARQHKPTFTPGVGNGRQRGGHQRLAYCRYQHKMEDKVYHKHSGYPGGLKSITLREQL